jgi:hypothetical protein
MKIPERINSETVKWSIFIAQQVTFCCSKDQPELKIIQQNATGRQ